MISKAKLAFAAINIGLWAACSPHVKTLHNNSSPAIHFVLVEKNVKLEVLDWGGKGKSIVLLAGGGNTAHVFDDFAPKLAKHFHVMASLVVGSALLSFLPLMTKIDLLRISLLFWIR